MRSVFWLYLFCQNVTYHHRLTLGHPCDTYCRLAPGHPCGTDRRLAWDIHVALIAVLHWDSKILDTWFTTLKIRSKCNTIGHLYSSIFSHSPLLWVECQPAIYILWHKHGNIIHCYFTFCNSIIQENKWWWEVSSRRWIGLFLFV